MIQNTCMQCFTTYYIYESDKILNLELNFERIFETIKYFHQHDQHTKDDALTFARAPLLVKRKNVRFVYRTYTTLHHSDQPTHTIADAGHRLGTNEPLPELTSDRRPHSAMAAGPPPCQRTAAPPTCHHHGQIPVRPPLRPRNSR
jgi:branched-subunit amino acid aminotransferase/4-amino-4-deoxychorismate lyase